MVICYHTRATVNVQHYVPLQATAVTQVQVRMSYVIIVGRQYIEQGVQHMVVWGDQLFNV